LDSVEWQKLLIAEQRELRPNERALVRWLLEHGVPDARLISRWRVWVHALEKDFLLREDTYGRTVLELTLARAYLKKLLDNGRVVRYLAQKYRDLLAEFQRIVETTALDKLNAG